MSSGHSSNRLVMLDRDSDQDLVHTGGNVGRIVDFVNCFLLRQYPCLGSMAAEDQPISRQDICTKPNKIDIFNLHFRTEKC